MLKLSPKKKVVKAVDSNTAMLETKPIRYEQNGDILFATVAQPIAIVTPSDSDEGAFMGMTLDALRAGEVEPMARLSKQQMDEIENDRIGADGWQL